MNGVDDLVNINPCTRIERLRRAPANAKWVTVQRVDASGVAHVATVASVPRIEGRLALGQLSVCYGPLHVDILAMRDKVDFWRAAHEALRASRTPFRVVFDDKGWVQRPYQLGRLFAEGRLAPRVALRWRQRTWIDHIYKHLLPHGPDGGEHFVERLVEQRVRRLTETPIEAHHLREALQLARANVPQVEPRSLPGVCWPLVELYSELTLDAFSRMLEGAVVHGFRQGFAPTPIYESEDDLDFREDELLVSPFFDLLSVAQGDDDPAHWTTTYRREAVLDWLQRRARQFLLAGGCQTWGLPRVPGNRA